MLGPYRRLAAVPGLLSLLAWAMLGRLHVAGTALSMSFLIAGWTRLSPADRETWQALEAATPNGLLIGEIAWAACDGRRTIDEVARLVWLETGQSVPEFVTSLFEWTERLGESGWAPVADPASAARG